MTISSDKGIKGFAQIDDFSGVIKFTNEKDMKLFLADRYKCDNVQYILPKTTLKHHRPKLVTYKAVLDAQGNAVSVKVRSASTVLLDLMEHTRVLNKAIEQCCAMEVRNLERG